MKRLISSWLNKRMTLFCKLITDVFLILTNYFRKLEITADIKMPLTNSNPKVEDLNKIVEGNKDFIPNILAAHGLSGCNVTARYYGIAKETIVNQLKGGFELQNSDNIGIDAPTVLLKSSELIGWCYDFKANNLCNCRIKLGKWRQLKQGKIIRDWYHYHKATNPSKKMYNKLTSSVLYDMQLWAPILLL